MEPIHAHAHGHTLAKPAPRRTIWQRVGLIALAFSIMFLSLKACPADIQVRSTDAVVAGFAVGSMPWPAHTDTF